MSKSIKFTNNTYIDDSGVAHYHRDLKTVIDEEAAKTTSNTQSINSLNTSVGSLNTSVGNLNTHVTNLNTSLNNLAAKVNTLPRIISTTGASIDIALNNAGITDAYMHQWGNNIKGNIGSWRGTVRTVSTQGPAYDTAISGLSNTLWSALMFNYASAYLIKLSEVNGTYYCMYLGV